MQLVDIVCSFAESISPHDIILGIVPYYYDVIRPNTAVELDGCIYNHMGINVYYEEGGILTKGKLQAKLKRKFNLTYEYGDCRNGWGKPPNCTDCRATPLQEIKTVHFTSCGKPWRCAIKGTLGRKQLNFTLCHGLQTKWTDIRLDLESKLHQGHTTDRNNGTFATDIYQGICHGIGSENYIPIDLSPLTVE